MNQTKEHQELLDYVLFILGSTQLCRLWKVATGVGHPLGRPDQTISFGLKGGADISGITRNGKRIEIEIKTGNARQNKDQLNFMAMIRRYGGIYSVIHSKSEADFLKQWMTEYA